MMIIDGLVGPKMILTGKIEQDKLVNIPAPKHRTNSIVRDQRINA